MHIPDCGLHWMKKKYEQRNDEYCAKITDLNMTPNSMLTELAEK